MAPRASVAWMLTCSAILSLRAKAQRSQHDDNIDSNNGFESPQLYIEDNSNGSNRFFNFIGKDSACRALSVHAITACAVWILLLPTGGMLLRLDIRSSWIVRLHAALQMTAYLIFIAAVGLGNWTPRDNNPGPFLDLWTDPHPHFGISILALAVFQMLLGFSQHQRLKKRLACMESGKLTKIPGVTISSYIEIWLARDLIVLGVINSDLILRLGGQIPFQSCGHGYGGNAWTIYSVCAILGAVIYLVIMLRFEAKDPRMDRDTGTTSDSNPAMGIVPPMYLESRESLHKPPRTSI